MCVNNEPSSLTSLQNNADPCGTCSFFSTNSKFERPIDRDPCYRARSGNRGPVKQHCGALTLCPVALDLSTDLFRANALFVRAGPVQDHIGIGREALQVCLQIPVSEGIGESLERCFDFAF